MQIILHIIVVTILAIAANVVVAPSGHANEPEIVDHFSNSDKDSLLATEEKLLKSAVTALISRDLVKAQEYLDKLTTLHPNHRLAHLISGDILMAKANPLSNVGMGVKNESMIEGFIAELEARMNHLVRSEVREKWPSSIIKLSESQPTLLVDIAAARIRIISQQGNDLNISNSFYASTGKKGAHKRVEGDQKTPVGIYFITSVLGSETLPDFYGVGALPVNYPNEWDQRLGRTGYGIWIHGVPFDTYSRSPRSSDGCIALSNHHLKKLFNLPAKTNTPVILSSEEIWLSGEAAKRRQAEWLERINSWRSDWESLDVERYLRHYSKNFQNSKYNLAQWRHKKKRTNVHKRFINVGLDDIAIYQYPNEQDLVLVKFFQSYKSNTFVAKSGKYQYWQRETDNNWYIVYEDVAKYTADHLRGIPYSARAKISKLSFK